MQYIRIGVISKAQGIKGQVKIMILSDDPTRFEDLKHVWLEQNGQYNKLKLLESCVREQAAFAFLEGVDDRNKAELLRNIFVCVPKEMAIRLPEGRYFIFDLIGCQVFDDQHTLLGTLTDVLQSGSTDVYQISGDKRFMVPALKKMMLEVDIENHKIIFDRAIFNQVVCYDENDDKGFEKSRGQMKDRNES